MPKVSIIVPCYNVEKYLDRCVTSLVNQTLSDIEIVLVDDQSPDRVPQMCDEWAAKDARIKVIHKKNGGLGMACNSGIEIATGDFIAFCDSDDWVELNMYEEMHNAAIEHKADLVFTGLQRIDDKGEITPLSQIEQFEARHKKEDVLMFGLDMIASAPSVRIERRFPMSAKTALYNREKVIEHTLRFESERNMISEDLLWNLDNIAHAEGIVIMPRYFYYYYDNANSLTNTIRQDRFTKYKLLYEELVKRTENLGYPVAIKQRIDRMFLGYSRHRIVLLCKNDIPQKDRLAQMKQVCCDSLFRSILKRYPTRQMPLAHRVSALLMKWKAYTLMRLILK